MLPKSLDPLQHMQHEAKLKATEEKMRTQQERIQAILQGEQPKDELSWEFYIWKTHGNPLRIK